MGAAADFNPVAWQNPEDFKSVKKKEEGEPQGKTSPQTRGSAPP